MLFAGIAVLSGIYIISKAMSTKAPRRESHTQKMKRHKETVGQLYDNRVRSYAEIVGRSEPVGVIDSEGHTRTVHIISQQ